MPDWLAELASRIGSVFANSAPTAHLGAFGKHPGWNDHLDDLGMDSEPLLATKQYLYLEGIGGLIDAGQWEALAPEDVLPDFRHVFVWLEGDNLLIGRMWSSSDGKGRAKYPMVACAHFRKPAAGQIPDVLPMLERLELSCRATTSAEDVRAVTNAAREEIKPLLAAPGLSRIDRQFYASRLNLNVDAQATQRIVYAVESYLSPLASFSAPLNLKLSQSKGHPYHIRLPALTSDPMSAFQFWKSFLAFTLPAGVPQLFICPLNADWVDVIVGVPTAKHLFCLKAGSRILPSVAEIPFEISSNFVKKSAFQWASFLSE